MLAKVVLIDTEIIIMNSIIITINCCYIMVFFIICFYYRRQIENIKNIIEFFKETINSKRETHKDSDDEDSNTGENEDEEDPLRPKTKKRSQFEAILAEEG